tara:strand:+ start:60 stop:257 length:198 start_codon:yes stop_codon:yes gene_type:complete
MLLPVKFISANIFIMGVTAGAVCGAIAVYTLSDLERLNRLNDYAKELCKGCKKKFELKSNPGWEE